MTTAILDRPITAPSRPALPPTRSKPEAVKERIQAHITPIYDALFAPIQHQYQIYDEPKVLTFLRNHSQLIPILQEGRTAVNVVFGEEVSIRLRIQRDPEVGIEYLTAWIHSDLPSTEAVDRLMEFADTWYLDQMETVGDLLHFNLG